MAELIVGYRQIRKPVTITSEELFSVAKYCREYAKKIYLENNYNQYAKKLIMQKLERIAITSGMLATGKSINEIAEAIKIKEITLKDYIHTILDYNKK